MKMNTNMKKLIILLLMWCWMLPQIPKAQAPDFREETIYFLITTRFFDGDPSNNRPNEWCSYNPTNPSSLITDPQDVTWRGDFKGLIQKLDYIKDLGFTAIWITPIVQNWSPLDYHGYHAYDFTKVDPRLESPGATFQDLINQCHARGMKIVLDIVTNHAGRFGIKGKSEIKYNTDPTQSWGKDLNGNPLQVNPNWQYDGMTPNPADGKIWSRANLPKLPAPYNSNLAAYNWPSTESYVLTSDPEWYHHSGNGFAQGWDDTENLYNRALAGDCPDLNTGTATVRNYLIAAYTKFIQMGVDGFRWDTIKHMSKEDILVMLDAFKAVNPNLFVVGEVAQKRHELHNVEEINPHWYTWRGAVGSSANSGMAVFDFYAQASMHNPIEYGGGYSQLKDAARYDHLYSDPSTNVMWLDNHDFGPNNDWNRRFGGTPQNLAACMNFMFTWRGIPCVYYGTEVQFKKGAFTDIHEASDINKSLDLTGRAYFGAEFDNAPNHKIYQHLKKLNAIRRAVPALQKGSWRWDGTGDGNGIGFVRKHGTSEVAVGLAKDGAVTFNFSGLTNGTYRDAVTGKTATVSNGTLSFTVPATSAGIYVLNGMGMIGGNGVGYFEAGVTGNQSPALTINPAGGNFPAGTVTVTMSATDDSGVTPSIYYTTNGTTPTTSSTKYTSALTFTSATTLKAIAVDNQGLASTVQTYNYTFNPATYITLHWKVPTGCTTPTMYFWNVSPAGSTTTWPGVAMTSEGNGWYKTQIQGDCANVIFSCNGANQTPDLVNVCGEKWYDNGWVSQPIVDTQAPTLTVNPVGGTFNNSVSVTISATDNNGTPTIYYTIDGTTPNTSSLSASGTKSLTFTTTTTLKAFAKDAAGNNSAVTSQVYTVNDTQVPTLTFSPMGGTFTGTVNLTISATDNRGTPTIYYTTNGTTPTTSSASASGTKALTISATTTVKAFARDAAGNNSAVSSQVYTINLDTQAPTLSFSPVGGTFTNTVNLTLSATDNVGTPTIYYTTDGTTPTTSSLSASGNKALIISATTTVKAFARDAAGNSSAVATQVYTINVSSGFTVYFKRPITWTTTPKIHHWNALPTGSVAATTWPGVNMTADANGWWKFTFPSTVTSTSLLFHNGSGTQTADLTRNKTGWYKDGVWYDSNPENTTGFKVFFKPTTYTNPNIYYWNVQPAGAMPTVTWPGVKMITLSNGWYEFMFNGTSCTNLIFSNNGASQTADLSRCSVGWYTNGAWSNTAPTGAPTSRETDEELFENEGLAFDLMQNYPNPFKGTTTFQFSLEEDTEVSLKVYNLTGAEVANVVEEKLERGMHLLEWNANNVEEGIYIYRLVTPKGTLMKKMLITR
jgi:glycosidase